MGGPSSAVPFRRLGPTRYLLDTSYKKIKRNITLLCVSPISKETVIAALKAAKSVNAPLIFASSLNQVDVDGGYTGWTPRQFVDFVHQEAKFLEFNAVLFELDHGGPWLKDEHIVKNYDYYKALDSIKKSIEHFIKAGFNVLHIDTSIDRESSTGFADINTAAKRTVELIEYAEDIARYMGNNSLEYEIGSDRWNLNDVDNFGHFVSSVIGMLKAKNIDKSKIVFAVADVGTRVSPGNRLNISLALKFVNALKDSGIYLKIHSGDYLENPSDLPNSGVGGINIGPMFAHVQYRTIKEIIMGSCKDHLLKIFKENIEYSIVSSDKLGRYFGNKQEFEEYKIGIASRYIWSRDEIRNTINMMGGEVGVDIFKKCIEAIEESIRWYLVQLNLANIINIFKSVS